MKQSSELDFIIIGQGLAGSMLALELLKYTPKLAVFDLPDQNRSSSVAAGLFNPVTGRRFVQTWQADKLFPFLFEFYRGLETDLHTSIFFPLPVFRPFLSVEDRKEKVAKVESGELDPYVDRIVEKLPEKTPFYGPFGGLFLKNSGFVDVPELLSGIRRFLQPRLMYFDEFFEHEKLIVGPDNVRYGELSARKIIFCEGHSALKNPYFNWIPFRPVKGEIITIVPEVVPNFIFNRQIFVIPWQDGTCRVGATYDWDYKNPVPTAEAREYFIEKLERFMPVNYRITGHVAGVRPAMVDRRPVAGIHPRHPFMGIFNGLGSKGVSLAPYFARQFVDNLLNTGDLEKEVDINRFN